MVEYPKKQKKLYAATFYAEQEIINVLDEYCINNNLSRKRGLLAGAIITEWVEKQNKLRK